MTTKSKSKRLQEAKSYTSSVDQQLEQSNEAYSQNAFRFLRLLVHLLGAAQFIYGIYYHWVHVHWSKEENDISSPQHWGGKFKFLTFLDVIIQAVYHTIALLNDFFGSNAVNPRPVPVLRKVKDFLFAALAFPIAHNVCISFWVIYAYDRELIFPSALDAIFPNWLNHIVHTNVAMLAIMDVFTCFREYPKRRTGLGSTMFFMTLYVIWIHIVRYFSGRWVYPILEVLNMPMRYVMLSAMMGFTAVCYLLGEKLNAIIWAPELKLLKQKQK